MGSVSPLLAPEAHCPVATTLPGAPAAIFPLKTLLPDVRQFFMTSTLLLSKTIFQLSYQRGFHLEEPGNVLY